jgi:hypothetical protein
MKTMVPVFVLVAAAALMAVSTPARAEDTADPEPGPPLTGALCDVPDGETSWSCWRIDKKIIAAAETPGATEGRDQLVPVLLTAHARRAAGYDRLRAGVCTEDETMSPDRTRACSTLPAGLEKGWRRTDHIRQWTLAGLETAVYAGAITETTVAPHSSVSRGIATASVVPVGAAAGLMVFDLVATNTILGRNGPLTDAELAGHRTFLTGMTIAGAIVGGVAGGWLAYSHTASPSSRPSVTFWTLTPLYLTSLVTTFIY